MISSLSKHKAANLTGSSAFPVLLIADETSLISSIIVVKSLLMSVRRSETRSAVLYLVMIRMRLYLPSKIYSRSLTFLIRTL